LSFSISGCYLGHVAGGQLRLLRAERSIEEVVADPETAETLRHQLETVQQARQFAIELGLEVDGQYKSFVDWPGDRIVTIVAASQPGEITPAGFWFPFLGTLPYKGYFDPDRAEAEANSLRVRGLDVCIAPVPAYSTLGWLDDPITSPMLLRGEGQAVETVFHELVHATVYLRDHAEFNETAASFIGQEASVRFYEARSEPDAARIRRQQVAESRALNAVLIDRKNSTCAVSAPACRNVRRAACSTARLATRTRTFSPAASLRTISA
jgi:predicted aminopeptidase